MTRRPQPRIDRGFDIDRGIDVRSRQTNAQQIGTSYLWIGSTGKLIQILNAGDPGYEENAKIVAAALRPNGDIK
jgi:hypothetical protein